MAKKDLVQIIKDNPGCIAQIDNDCWFLMKPYPEGYDKWSEGDQEEWSENAELASSNDDLKPLGDGGYGSGNCYGGDILQALAIIVGIQVESV